MKKRLLIVIMNCIVLLSACVTIASAAPIPIGQDNTWELVFYDEFNDDTLNKDYWVTCYWWDNDGCSNEGNNELQWYQPDNVILEDGILTLQAISDSIKTDSNDVYEYSSGMITTGRRIDDFSIDPGFIFQYGYVEVRARIPDGQGVWPAIWLLPDDHTSKPEIDILEILGHEPDSLYMSIHYLDEEGERQREQFDWVGTDFSDDWHTFAIEWQEDYLIWYIDGIERARLDDTADILTKDMYLIINLAIGGDWAGDPDEDTVFPADFQIDYVRIWQEE